MGARGPGARPVKRAAAAAPAHKRGLPWKRKGLSRPERVIKFLQWLPVTKGMLAGKKMKLLPGQRRFVKEVYGRLDRKRRRIVRIAVMSEPAGSGKTGFIAGLQLCHLLGPEAETRGECDAAAVDRTQSSKMFDEMEAIIVEVPEFSSRVNIKRHEKKIEVLDGEGKGSRFEAMSGDARKGHGLAPSFWSYDELAQVSDRALLDNLISRMGKRDEALGIIISTQAATDDHALSQLIDDGLEEHDPSLYVQLTAVPEDADVFDLEVVKAANEALGKFLNPVDVKNDLNRARRMPAWEPKFRNERCNQRVEASSLRIVTREVWAENAMAVDRDALRRRLCYGGLDLSGKHDLTALVLVFPDDGPEPAFDILPFFWTPEGQIANRRPRERDQFRLWIREGHLIEVPGPVVRYDFVAHQLAELASEFEIAAIGYDRYRIEDLKQDLGGVGVELPLHKFGQGWGPDMPPAIDYFAELALTGRLRHGGHPVLTACVANAILIRDPAGNQKFDKDRANQSATVRIDGAVALAMALGTAKRFVDGPSENLITSDKIVERGGLL